MMKLKTRIAVSFIAAAILAVLTRLFLFNEDSNLLVVGAVFAIYFAIIAGIFAIFGRKRERE